MLTPEELDDWIKATIVGLPEDLRRPQIGRAAMTAGIDPFAAWEAYNRLEAAKVVARAAAEERKHKPRLPSATRMRRAEDRQPLPPTQYTPAMALEPLNDPLLSASAKVLLMHLRALAGNGKVLETLTCSLATLLGCSRRAVQVWRRELVEAGLVVHRYDKHRGIVIFEMSALLDPTVPVAPPKRLRTPTPDMRFWQRWAARMEALRRRGREALAEGANQVAHIKILDISTSKSVLAT